MHPEMPTNLKLQNRTLSIFWRVYLEQNNPVVCSAKYLVYLFHYKQITLWLQCVEKKMKCQSYKKYVYLLFSCTFTRSFVLGINNIQICGTNYIEKHVFSRR